MNSYRIHSLATLILTVFLAPPLFAWQPPGYATPYVYYPAPYPVMPYAPAPHTQPVNYRGYYPLNPILPPTAPMYAPGYSPWPQFNAIAPINTSRENKTSALKKAPLNNSAMDQTKTEPSKPLASARVNKAEFIERLLPHIQQENSRLSASRERLKGVFEKIRLEQSIDKETDSWIKRLVKKYRVSGDPIESESAAQELIRKIDIIPTSLALAQAANESAWGKSRFATQANNLFGIWTYDESKGLKPLKRDKDQKHLVRKFDHFGESVGYYMHTLNSHPAYKKLRQIRKQMREQQLPLKGEKLAVGLEEYSAIGQKYIRIIQDIIRQNEWAKLDEQDKPA